jgi:AraC family transcriptional regulator of adaptative response/methylated-DNA-[protein]-cysteine methyltransferase
MSRSTTIRDRSAKRWKAVVARDAAAEQFVYAVRTTGIFCRPGCTSRLPRRDNVEFFDSPGEARAAGYRACRRCSPDGNARADAQAERVVRACRFIEETCGAARLAAVAAHVSLSVRQLHRLFRDRLGVTPREYAVSRRVASLQEGLANGQPVARAIYSAGYSSAGRCYAEGERVLGMTPKRYRDRGRGCNIRYAIAGCTLGRVLVAVTERGVCRIALGDEDAVLRSELLARFPEARLVTRDNEFGGLLTAVVKFIDRPAAVCPFPLDIRGTAFQRRVWQALQQVPPGETRTYGELAATFGQPAAARAVGAACAANPLAVAVPCHRAVLADEGQGGYRWGPRRKQALLEREAMREARGDANASSKPRRGA